jgi:CheY-like chemotaxis protein
MVELRVATTAGEAIRGRHSDAATDASLITVIEDEAIVLVGYQMLFESWGYDVVAASSAADALVSLRAAGRVPDIIIADYRLKDGQTGVSAIRAVQAEFGHDIPAILVTGDTGTERLREAAASGLPILHKPVNGGQLRELLTRSLG